MTGDRGDRERRARHIRRVMDAEGAQVRSGAGQKNAERYRAIAEFPEWEALRDRAREVKVDAIDRLPSLIETVTDAVEANGGTVYLADDAADANEYIADVVDDVDGETVVKSKSMTTEEIDLNDHLHDVGASVWETDLGEFVIQLAEEDPSHIVGPAMHKSREEIASLFEDRFDPDRPLETPEDLTRFARDVLGERILEADVGVTGANFVLSDSGSVVLVTNEGNARKCAVTPDTHVAVAGVEKLIPSVDDLQPFARIIARAATGQPISRYLSVLTPPTATPTMDLEADEWGSGERSFHLVLLDNGRFDMREDDQLRETLYCIRCGACSNSCSNFQHVGGHAFGGETYSGGIATGWEAGVHGEESAAEFNDLCTGCTRCVAACPVKIDVPWINTVVRDRLNRSGEPDAFDHLVDGLAPDVEEPGLALDKRLFGNVETLARLGSATAPVSNWLSSTRPVRAALEHTVGIDRRRELPTFVRETFVDRFESTGGRATSERRAQSAREDGGGSGASEERASARDQQPSSTEAVVYPDTYTNYVAPERGMATVRTLEALGVAVRVPRIGESGRAPLSQGMIASASACANRVHEGLAEHVEAGRSIVVIEPSDLAVFEREYDRLLPGSAARRLGRATASPFDLIADRIRSDGIPDALTRGDGRRVAYHPHCQGRTVGVDGPTIEVLDRLGYDVRPTTVECCGMAGSFGYKRAYYELSVSVGRSFRDDVEETDADVVAAGGVSCRDQLEHVASVDVRHPVELVAPSGSDGDAATNRPVRP